MSQIHYEVLIRKPGAGSWTLEIATEDRARAMETADELLAAKKASAVRVTKEIQDEATLEFKSVNILTKGDVGKADKKKKEKEVAPLCVSPQDLYTIHARDVIGRLLEAWLAREKATTWELLHRADLIEKLDAAGMDLQHAIQKIAIPEANDRGASVHEIIRHFQTLTTSAIDRVLRDEKKGLFPDFEKEPFARACERIRGESEQLYLLGGGVARALGRAASWAEKVNRLLDLADAAPQQPAARALAFQVLETPLAEILGSKAGAAALLGPSLDLGGTLAAMARLTSAEAVDVLLGADPNLSRHIPPLNGAAARLATWLESDKFHSVRSALGKRVLDELASARRLRPGDAEGEIEILRALAMCLTTGAGKHLPLEKVHEAFSERSRMLVRTDFVEAFLGKDRTAMQEAEALIWLAENVTGAANKRSAYRWIFSQVSALKFERELRAAPEPPAAKLASLAALQKAVSRVGFVQEELGPLQGKIGEIAGLIEGDTKLVSLIAKARSPSAARLTVLLRMAIGETAPLGPVADRARAEVMKLTRAPEVRAELASSPEQLQSVRTLMQSAGLAA